MLFAAVSGVQAKATTNSQRYVTKAVIFDLYINVVSIIAARVMNEDRIQAPCQLIPKKLNDITQNGKMAREI